jgi:translation initiation factor 2 alpha subunit (eIF-2alpha)
MRKAESVGNEDCPVKIKLVAAPLYVLTTQTLDKVSNYVFSSLGRKTLILVVFLSRLFF